VLVAYGTTGGSTAEIAGWMSVTEQRYRALLVGVEARMRLEPYSTVTA
jgi:hypothetical protein